MTFQNGSDVKKTFETLVDQLLEINMPVEWRIQNVARLTETYLNETGKKPDGYQLQRLTDYILKDDLSDPHPDKVTNTEYPILSLGQIKLRINRELSIGDGAYYTKDVKHKLHGNRKKVEREL